MAFKIQLRRDLSSKWTQNNPVLLLGEFGYEYDTGYAKIGDGQSPWRDLSYFVGGTGPFGANNFLSLDDTPSGYTGSEGYHIRVNPSGTGIQFISSDTLSSLIDIRRTTGFTPGDSLRYLRVNAGGTGLEWATVSGGTGGGTYSNSTATLTGVGGIDQESIFDNVLLDRMWNLLLHPEEEPGFEDLSVNPNGSTGSYEVLEVGQSMTPTVNFYWDVKNANEFKPNTIDIYDVTDDFPIDSNLGVTGASPFTYTYASSVSYNDKDSHVWKFTGIGQNEVTFSKFLTVNWYYPILYGRSSDDTLTNTQIANLSRSVQPDSDGEYIFSSSTDEFTYICIPDGEADYNIKGMFINGYSLDLADSDDGYSLVDSGGLTYRIANPVDINGVVKAYRVYRSKNIIKSPVTIKVSNSDPGSGLKITGKLSPLSDSEDYAITDTIYGIDGLRNVQSLSDMYSIPPDRRRLGMVVGVGITGESGTYFKLIRDPGGSITTSLDWGIFNNGSITYSGGTGSTGISGITGINIEGGQRVDVTLTESPPGVAKYTVDIPQLISGGTAL